MRVEVTSEEVTRLYAQGGAETDESTALYFVSTDCMKEDRMEGEFVRRFTPHCAASRYLIKQRLESQP